MSDLREALMKKAINNIADKIAAKVSEAGTSVEVKPCPLCGATPRVDERASGTAVWFVITCYPGCGLGLEGRHEYAGAMYASRTAKSVAIAAWNRRALIQPTPAETEVTDEMVEQAWKRLTEFVYPKGKVTVGRRAYDDTQSAKRVIREELSALAASPTPPPIGDAETPYHSGTVEDERLVDRLRKLGDWLDFDFGRDDPPAGDVCREAASALTASQARVEELERERDGLRAALIEAGRAAGGGLADTVSSEFLSHVPTEVRALSTRLQEAEKALEPFAEVGEVIDSSGFGAALFPDADTAFSGGLGAQWTDNDQSKSLKWGDFRRARSALKGEA